MVPALFAIIRASQPLGVRTIYEQATKTGATRGASPQFTVLIPVRDGAGFLAGAISSVLLQSNPDWELVIGDNASTDATADVARGFTDGRIRYVRWDDPVDIFRNFVRTYRLARGAWVYLLPADDRLAPSCLERIMAAIDAHTGQRPLAAVVSRAARVDPSGRPIETAYYGVQGVARVRPGTFDAAAWLAAVTTPGSAPWDGGAFNREVLEAAGGFYRTDIPSMSSDMELMIRVGAYGDVIYLDEPLISVMGSATTHTPGRVRRNLESGEPFTPQGIALAEGLRAHERTRVVLASERAAVNAAIARTHLRRATAHRILAGGCGRQGALHDVARAARLSPRTLARSLPTAALTVLAPAPMLIHLRERILRRR
jgi:hypothetical protein